MNAIAEKNDRQRKRLSARILHDHGRDPSPRDRLMDRHARTVVLVGCGKSKSDEAAPARELYTSSLFKKSVELAELVGDAVYIASAAKVLVGLDERITPYEKTLRAWPRWAKEEWGADVIAELVTRTLGAPTRVRVVLLMGCTYADPILSAVRAAKAIHEDRWSEPVDLLRGLQIGDRLSFLNLALSTLRQGGSVRGLSRKLLHV